MQLVHDMMARLCMPGGSDGSDAAGDPGGGGAAVQAQDRVLVEQLLLPVAKVAFRSECCTGACCTPSHKSARC